jgi:hypothetical protein
LNPGRCDATSIVKITLFDNCNKSVPSKREIRRLDADEKYEISEWAVREVDTACTAWYISKSDSIIARRATNEATMGAASNAMLLKYFHKSS